MTIHRANKVVVSTPGTPIKGSEREITVPGRNEAPKPAPVSPAELRATRLLVAITAAVGLAFAIVAVVGLQVVIHVIRGGNPTDEPECDNDRNMECPDDQLCQSGRCRPAPTEIFCEDGDPCGSKGECTCDQPMSCESNVCKAPSTEVPGSVCDKPKIQEALAQLNRECKGDLGRCAPGALNDFAMNYEGFDELVSAFPGTISLHFETGKPPLGNDKQAWPSPKTEDYYVQSLRRSSQVLLDAKFVFIIARSSPHGNVRRNGLFAQQRSIKAKDFLFAALDLPTLERDNFSSKFREFILGPKRRLDRDFFAQRYHNRFITWNKTSHNVLLKLIKDDKPSERDAEWLDDTINQVVLIVPVSCDLKAATPAPSE